MSDWDVKCQVCGSVAIRVVVDTISHIDDRNWRVYEPYGERRAGCALHPVESHEYRRDENVQLYRFDLGAELESVTNA